MQHASMTRRAWGRLFEGTLVYDSALDTTPLIDFYEGSVHFYLEVVPEPSSLALTGCGLAVVFAGTSIRRWLRR